MVTVWILFLDLIFLYLQAASSVLRYTPSSAYICHLKNSDSSQEGISFTSAIQQVNAEPTLLPNTTLYVAGTKFNEDDPMKFAVNATDMNVSALLVDHHPTTSHESVGALLTTPLVTTRPSRAVPYNVSCLSFGVCVGPSPSDIGAALLAVIQKYGWKTMFVIYDIRWRDHASVFVSQIPSTLHYEIVDVVFDRKNKLHVTSKEKLSHLTDHPTEAMVVFCDAGLAKAVIDEVHSPVTHQKFRTHKWLLADPIESSRTQLDTEHSQIVIGLAPNVVNNARTSSLHTSLNHINQTTKFATYLLYDAVFVYAHALHDMLVDNQWEATPHDGNLMTSHNGEVLMSYMRKLTVTGTTGMIKIDAGGSRRDSNLDIYNLRNNLFIKIGKWSASTALSMTSSPVKNSLAQNDIPLSHLKRKLRVVILAEQAPFAISEKDPVTGAVSYKGYSIDMISALAEVLGFKYELYTMKSYGGKNPDGTFSGLLGEVQSGRADMSVMPLTINSDRLQYMDFSEPFMHISMDLVLRKPKEDEVDITGFMTPYTVPVWCMTLVCWFFVTIILSLVNYYSPYGHRLCDDDNDGDEFSFFNSLWFCLASMLQQGGDATPRMLSGRIVTGSFWFCVLVWISTYTANLAAFLTTDKADTAIANLDDVLNKDYSMYIMRQTALYEYLRVSQYQTYRLLFERMLAENTFVNTTEEGDKKVRAGEKVVFLSENPFAEYLIKQEPCDLMSVKGLMGSTSYGIGMPRDFPYGPNISRAILELHENGKLEGMRRKWWENYGKCPDYKQLTSAEIIESKRIQLGNMLGVYIVLGLGGIVSIFVVLGEIQWKRKRDRMKERVRKGWSTIRGTKTAMAFVKKAPSSSDEPKPEPIQPFGLALQAFGVKHDQVDARASSEIDVKLRNSRDSILTDLESES